MEQVLDSSEVNASTLNQNYAGFWIRFGAYLLDTICLLIIQVIIGFIAIGSSGLIDPPIALTLVNVVIGILYFVFMESSSNQATLGKMAVGIKVTDLEGNRISFGRALGRYLSKIISAVILFIGFIMAGFDAKKQGLHDKIAGTLVVSK